MSVIRCTPRDLATEWATLLRNTLLKRQRPRPTLTRLDRFFWTTLRHLWPRWSDVLLIVKPETVVRWHRAGFRLYWRWRSRPRGVLANHREAIVACDFFTVPTLTFQRLSCFFVIEH